MGPALGSFELSKGHLEVNRSKASAIWDPRVDFGRFEFLRIGRAASFK